MTAAAIVCPKCEHQQVRTFDPASGYLSLACPKCRAPFESWLMQVRAKNSRGQRNGGTRDFNVRVWDVLGNEHLMQFQSNVGYDVEMRSRDWVIFTRMKGRVCVVQNLTIGRYDVVHRSMSPTTVLWTVLILVVCTAVIFLVAVTGLR